jgi:hypothetical protein
MPVRVVVSVLFGEIREGFFHFSARHEELAQIYRWINGAFSFCVGEFIGTGFDLSVTRRHAACHVLSAVDDIDHSAVLLSVL